MDRPDSRSISLPQLVLRVAARPGDDDWLG